MTSLKPDVVSVVEWIFPLSVEFHHNLLAVTKDILKDSRSWVKGQMAQDLIAMIRISTLSLRICIGSSECFALTVPPFRPDHRSQLIHIPLQESP
jgi:hypothetical protein